MKKLLNLNKLLVLILVMTFAVVGCGKETPTESTYAEAEADTSKVEATTEATTEETTQAETLSREGLVQTSYPFTFTDKFGNEMTIESKPETIVSFAPEITETIYALGSGSQLVGRSTYCDYPAEVAEVADLGTLFEFSIEKVIEVNPDVVFLSSMVSEDVYAQLVDSNITVAVFDYDDNLMGTQEQIANIGAIIDQNDQAKAINADIQATIDELTQKAQTREPKSVYFAVSVGEYTSAATGDTFMNDIIVTTGAENAAADGTFWMYTVEQLVEKDPDILICSNKYDTKATIESLDGYKDLTAVKEGRLFEVDENIFFRQGPRVVEAMYAVEKIVYGDN